MEQNEKKAVPRVCESEYKMCLLLWDREPIRAADLARVCDRELDWSRTTTYTVIKRLCDRGVLVNESGIVRALFTKEEVQCYELEEMLEKTFQGSVPAFLAAFTKNRKLSADEIAGIMAMIERQ